jgi:serine/threonine protein kinase
MLAMAVQRARPRRDHVPVTREGQDPADPVLQTLPRDEIGPRLGEWRIGGLIGRGGMGRVYAASHVVRGGKAAIKIFHLASQGSRRELLLDRFRREARLAKAIDHPNVVRVLDAGEHRGVPWLAMERIEGETARQRVERKGRLELFEALAIAHAAAKGLAALHAARVIHRDVKPGNVLVARNAKVKLADLGLAKALDASAALTGQNVKLGTPRYAAPEQWSDAAGATPATDVWALGALLYYLLTGRDGIAGKSPSAIARQTCIEGFPRLRDAHREMPAAVDALIARATALDPAERYADGAALATAIRGVARVLRSPPPVGDEASRALSMILVPVAIAAGALLVWSVGPDNALPRNVALISGVAALLGFVAWRRAARQARARDAATS